MTFPRSGQPLWPKEWQPFWSFWRDQVQPAVRKALGRDDIWGIGLAMAAEPDDTVDRFSSSPEQAVDEAIARIKQILAE